VSIANNELTNIVFTCKTTELKADGTCPIPDGNYLRSLRGYDYFTIEAGIGILICYILVIRFIAYLGLRFIKQWL